MVDAVSQAVSASAVMSLAQAVVAKYQSVKTLRPECRRTSEICESVRKICAELEQTLASAPAPPAVGGPLKLLHKGLTEAGSVLDKCAARPVQAKILSGTYVNKLKAANSHMLQAMQLLSGARVGLPHDLREQAADAADGLRDDRRRGRRLASTSLTLDNTRFWPPKKTIRKSRTRD